MAEAELSSALNWLRGKFGDKVFKRRGKKIFVSKLPTFKEFAKTSAGFTVCLGGRNPLRRGKK